MGLEKLKSIFSNTNEKYGYTRSIHEGPNNRHVEDHTTLDDLLDFGPTPIKPTPKLDSLNPNPTKPSPDLGSMGISPEPVLPTLDSPEYFDMVRMPSEKLYNTYYYDPRSDVKVKNPYTGTRFDDGIAGIFPLPYYAGFATINSPKGYFSSETGNDIINSGNINSNGGGYPTKKPLMELYVGSKNSPPSRYYENGDINLSRTIVQDSIPSYNDNLNITPGFLSPQKVKDSNDIKDLGWQALYTNNHKPKDPFGGYHYSKFIDLEKLNIKNHSGDWRGGLLGDEPYIVSNMPRYESDGASGRTINMSLGGRSVPIVRALTDTVRLSSFIASPAGVAFALKQNIHTIVNTNVVKDKEGDGLIRVPQRFQTGYNPLSTIFSAGSRLLGIGKPNLQFTRREGIDLNLGGGGLSEAIRNWEQFKPGVTNRGVRPETKAADRAASGAEADARREAIADAIAAGGGNKYGVGIPDVDHSINDTFTQNDGSSTGESSPQDELEQTIKQKFGAFFGGGQIVPKTSTGDKMTLAPMIKGTTLEASDFGTVGLGLDGYGNVDQNFSTNIEAEENGMPFYFKDLRDGSYIFFRAFLEGVNEQLQPEWSPIDYIGRSESAYTYSKTSRTISMMLKVFAHTEAELKAIWRKINKLTSLTYPEYARGSVGMSKDRTRMKPPLIKLRLGEMYGNDQTEGLTGFFQSLTYDFPNEGPWETKRGMRVPKFINISFTYTVIHSEAPSLDMARDETTDGSGRSIMHEETFYGINKKDGVVGTGDTGGVNLNI